MLGRPHPLVLAILAIGLLVVVALFLALYEDGGDGAPVEVAGPEAAAGDGPPYCAHLVDANATHQILAKVDRDRDPAPPPDAAITVEVHQEETLVDQAQTDGSSCVSLSVPGAGSYVFSARYEQQEDGRTKSWWSGDVAGRYDGEPPGWLRIRLNNFAETNLPADDRPTPGKS